MTRLRRRLVKWCFVGRLLWADSWDDSNRPPTLPPRPTAEPEPDDEQDSDTQPPAQPAAQVLLPLEPKNIYPHPRGGTPGFGGR